MRLILCPSGQETKARKAEEFGAANDAGAAENSVRLTALRNGAWIHGFGTAFRATILLKPTSYKRHEPQAFLSHPMGERDARRLLFQVRRSLRIFRSPSKVSTGPETA